MRLNITQLIFGTGITVMSKPDKNIIREKTPGYTSGNRHKNCYQNLTTRHNYIFLKKKVHCDQLEFISGCCFI